MVYSLWLVVFSIGRACYLSTFEFSTYQPTRPTMPYDICCIGHTTMDRVVTPERTVHMPGGTSIYFSHAMASLRCRYALVTSLAPADEHVLDALLSRGIAVTLVPNRQTLFFENKYGTDSDDRTQKVLQVADPFTPQQLTGVDASIYHLGTLVAGDIPTAAIRTLAAKGRLSLDVQGFLRKVENQAVLPAAWLDKEAVLPLIHYLKANEEEARTLTGENDLAAAGEKMLALGAREVIITCGSRGSQIFTQEGGFTIPAFPPAVLTDATGCGDTYMAGYLYKRHQNVPVLEAGEFAAAMATLKLERSGPFAGTEDLVAAFLLAQKTQLNSA
jgi:sugar/nucleoside kinase (ribokinase family)